MKSTALATLCCPECRQRLGLETDAASGGEVTTGHLVCPCGLSFPIEAGVPDLVFPRGQSFEVEDAEGYDDLYGWAARLLREDLGAARAQVVELLELKPGDRVLEVACGPGSNFPQLLKGLGRGELFALDIAPAMLEVAGRRLVASGAGSVDVERVLGNAARLPFPDRSFDALLHIGTLNRLSDVAGVLAEMARVVKVGGKVVAGDEGIAPWLDEHRYGQVLKKFGSMFTGRAPLEALPASAREARVQWVFGQAFYVIDFRVGDEPQLNLDLKLPGRDVTVRQVLEAGSAKVTE